MWSCAHGAPESPVLELVRFYTDIDMDIESGVLTSRSPPPAGRRPLGIETGARGLMHLLMTMHGKQASVNLQR